MKMGNIKEKLKDLWLLTEKVSSPDDSWQLYTEIEAEFTELLKTKNKYQYDYIQFCLRYLGINVKRSDIIFRSLYHRWQNVYDNDDFPEELLTELLVTIKYTTFQYIDFNEIASCANKLFDNKKREIAIMYYDALDSKLMNVNSWDNWAQYYSNNKDFETAIKILERGLKKIPNSDFIVCNLAFYLVHLSKYETALKYLTHVIKKTEFKKFTSDANYKYAVSLKASIYITLDLPLHSFMENSRLLSTFCSDQSQIMDACTELLQWGESI